MGGAIVCRLAVIKDYLITEFAHKPLLYQAFLNTWSYLCVGGKNLVSWFWINRSLHK